MASFKAEKPGCCQSGKKEPAKAPVPKQAPPKEEQKPCEPKKKATGARSSAKK